MELHKQQQEALEAIRTFLSGDDSVFILKGYAGTGKTSLIEFIIELAAKEHRSCQLMAPTGRAAKILSDKTKFSATTIHKGIYELSEVEAIEGNENEESKIQYRFPIRQYDGKRMPGVNLNPKESLLIIDESSMISAKKSVDDLFIFGTGVLLDDIISFARLEDGGKIIFVGDPAQLPPVGDSESLALEPQYLENRRIRTSYYELTDVIRQDSDSILLSNSIKLRNLIESNIRTELILDRKDEEVEDITSEEIADRFCRISPTPSLHGPVIICYSNKTVAAYNGQIRQRYFHDQDISIQRGDRLVIVGNNYSSDIRSIFNGEFAEVENYSEQIEKQTGYVYVSDGSESKRRVSFDLTFRDVTLRFDDGSIIKKKIFDSLLNSSKPNITYQEQCALMSNFNIRHMGLKTNSPEYVHALIEDPYYNAIRAKYGYALTCHKAQGGEWETTFIDFRGRVGLSKDCLRWSYTAATRARKMMYGHLLHNIPALKAKVVGITSVGNLPSEYYPSPITVPTGPFNEESQSASLKALFWQVSCALEGTVYCVKSIEHLQYRETYSIGNSDGDIYRFDAIYNKAGIIRPFTTVLKSDAAFEILDILNCREVYEYEYSYSPSNSNLQELYSKIKSSCDDIGILITNVVEHLNNFKVMYYLFTETSYSYLEIYINKYGQVTYISPRVFEGKEDSRLNKLIEEISQ